MKKIICLICILCMAVLCTACGNETVGEGGKEIVFQFNDENIYLDEVFIYAMTTKEEYEREYGENIWGKTIVTYDGIETDVEEMAKKEVISNIVTNKVLIAHAADYGISLSVEEENEADSKAEEFYQNLTEDQLSEMRFNDRETIKKVLKENALADKVYAHVMKDNTSEVSDEQARMTTFYDLFFECYYEDEFGNIVPYSDDQVATQKENADSTYKTITEDSNRNGVNIAFFASNYDLKYAGSHTMSSQEIEDTYGEDVKNTLYDMQNGDVSKVIKLDDGYHIFQMTALTDEEATAQNKDQMNRKANQEYFDNIVSSWIEKLDPGYTYSKRVNMDVYNKIWLYTL